MRPFASVQLRMSFQVMEPPKARVASLAQVWLLVAVSEQMAFQVVVPGEFCRAVGAFVLLI